MKNGAKRGVLVLTAILLCVSSLAKAGYIEQNVWKDGGTMQNTLITDWSKLKPLQGTSEGELSVFLCMIAAQMLDPGMTRKEYFEYLDKKGLTFEQKELDGIFSSQVRESVCALYFSEKVSLFIIGDPIVGAWISVDTPFEVGGSADVPVDIANTRSPYTVLTDDGRYVDETEGDSQAVP